MAATKRLNILDALLARLTGMAGVITLQVRRNLPLQYDTQLPAIIIDPRAEIPIADEGSASVGGLESNSWEISIQVFSKTTDVEELLGTVYELIMADTSDALKTETVSVINAGRDPNYKADIPTGVEFIEQLLTIKYDVLEGKKI